MPFDNNSYKDTTIIDDNVNIRTTPGLTGAKIDKLNKGEEVQIIGIDPYYSTIDNYRGHWLKIKYGIEKQGFTF